MSIVNRGKSPAVLEDKLDFRSIVGEGSKNKGKTRQNSPKRMNYYYQEKQLYKDSMKHIHDIHGRFMPATSQESNKDHL